MKFDLICKTDGVVRATGLELKDANLRLLALNRKAQLAKVSDRFILRPAA
jgi:hypothetical protein